MLNEGVPVKRRVVVAEVAFKRLSGHEETGLLSGVGSSEGWVGSVGRTSEELSENTAKKVRDRFC